MIKKKKLKESSIDQDFKTIMLTLKKYYKKLKLKPVEVVDPPMGKRRASVEVSGDLISAGVTANPKGGILGTFDIQAMRYAYVV